MCGHRDRHSQPWPRTGLEGPQDTLGPPAPERSRAGLRHELGEQQALPSTAAGDSEPALVAVTCRAMHGACRQRTLWLLGAEPPGSEQEQTVPASPQVPEPRLAGSCRQRNGADGEHAARALHGTRSLRRGWQLRPPHAALVSRLAPRRRQLSQRTEPPFCTGATPMAPGALPHERGPAPPPLEPNTQPNPDLQVLPLPARSIMGPRGEREREREEVSAGCAPRVPAAHAAQTPHPSSAQV